MTPSACNDSPDGAPRTIKYSVKQNHRRKSSRSRGLVDRGANGSIAGSDMRVINTQESYIDLEGVTDHIIRQLQLVTAGAYVLTDQGPIIMVVHHAAHMPDGKTILSPGQLEAFGCTLQETSKRFTGVQPSLTSPSGHRLPLDIRRGLPYLRLRSFTDTEWATLPHVEFTHPGPWDPTSIDCATPDSWYDEHRTDPLTCPPFDAHGELLPPVID